MSHKPNAVPVLQEGTVYKIILDDGRKVHGVIYHACVASGKSYFAKGDKTYPSERVWNHSITGKTVTVCQVFLLKDTTNDVTLQGKETLNVSGGQTTSQILKLK